jgi:hypothetical protein
MERPRRDACDDGGAAAATTLGRRRALALKGVAKLTLSHAAEAPFVATSLPKLLLLLLLLL